MQPQDPSEPACVILRARHAAGAADRGLIVMDAQIAAIEAARAGRQRTQQEIGLFARFERRGSADAEGLVEAADFSRDFRADEQRIGIAGQPDVGFRDRCVRIQKQAERIRARGVDRAAGNDACLRVDVEHGQDFFDERIRIPAIVVGKGHYFRATMAEADVSGA